MVTSVYTFTEHYFLYNFFLTAECQKLKHGVPKGDKKRKKEVMEQIAKMEADLESKHQQELKDHQSGSVSQEVCKNIVTFKIKLV